MKLLKGLGISLLSLLLFFSLSVFGVAFLVNQTALNHIFITSGVNRLELASLANDFVAQQTSEDLPEEIGSAISNTITKLEPQLKQGINKAISSVYDYLLGKRGSPDLSMVLRGTFLSSDFLVAVIDELDVASLVKPFFHEQVAQLIPQNLAFLSSYIYPRIDELLVKQEPWIKGQLKAAVDPIADYLVGRSSNFTIAIPTKPVMDGLRGTLLKDIMEAPLSQLAGLPAALIEASFNEFFNGFSQRIPPSIEINETIIGKDLPGQIKASLAEAENALKQMRNYISYFQLGYVLLIVFMLLLIMGIAFIYREVKGTTRTLGAIFLVCGVIELSSLLIARGFISEQLGRLAHDIPGHLQRWLQQFLNNVSAPMQILSVVFIIGGIVLVVTSFVYKSQHALRWS